MELGSLSSELDLGPCPWAALRTARVRAWFWVGGAIRARRARKRVGLAQPSLGECGRVPAGAADLGGGGLHCRWFVRSVAWRGGGLAPLELHGVRGAEAGHCSDPA